MNTLILGRRGLGKTTLAVWHAQTLSNHIVAWSPGAQFKNADVRTHDLEVIDDWMDNADNDEDYFLEYVPEGDYDTDFTTFAMTIKQYGDFVLIIDEASEIQSPSKINDRLDKLIRRAPRREKGEKRPIDIVQTTHFPVDLHRTSFGLSDDAYIFRLTRQRDIDRIRVELGDSVADAVEGTKTPETSPAGRDVVHVNITTQQFEIMEDPTKWNTRIAIQEEAQLDDVA